LNAKVTIEGLPQLEKKLKKLGIDVDKVTGKAVARVALKMESDAKRLISRGERSGRTYKRGRKSHRASAPYEAPKTDTGNLVRNITTNFINRKKAEVGVFASRGAMYGAWLEFGTRNIAPRPWLSRTYNANREFADTAFLKELNKAIREAARG
jgi:HK97 gp10 family phage protein